MVPFYECYTDGSHLPHHPGKPGGWAVVFADGRKLGGGQIPVASITVMEAMAVIQALKAVPEGAVIRIFTDSHTVMTAAARRPITPADRAVWLEKTSPEDWAWMDPLYALMDSRHVILTWHEDADLHPLHAMAHQRARDEADRAAATQPSQPPALMVPGQPPAFARTLQDLGQSDRITALHTRLCQARSAIYLLCGNSVQMMPARSQLRTAKPDCYAQFRSPGAKKRDAVFARSWDEIAQFQRRQLSSRDLLEVAIDLSTGDDAAAAFYEALQRPPALPPAADQEQPASAASGPVTAPADHQATESLLSELEQRGYDTGDLRRQLAFDQSLRHLSTLQWREEAPGRYVREIASSVGPVAICLAADRQAGCMRPLPSQLLLGEERIMIPSPDGAEDAVLWSHKIRRQVGDELTMAGLSLSTRRPGGLRLKVVASHAFEAQLQQALEAHWEARLTAIAERLEAAPPGSLPLLLRAEGGTLRYRWLDQEDAPSSWERVPAPIAPALLRLWEADVMRRVRSWPLDGQGAAAALPARPAVRLPSSRARAGREDPAGQRPRLHIVG